MPQPIDQASDLFGPLTVEKKTSFNLQDLVTEFPDDHSDWSIPEAFLCLILSAALADGRIAQQETEELRVLAHRSRVLRNLDPNELASLNRTIVKRRTDRPDWLREACRTLPQDMHLTVLAHCIDICLADGAMVPAEAEYLEALIGGLNVSSEAVHQVAQVLSIKNRY